MTSKIPFDPESFAELRQTISDLKARVEALEGAPVPREKPRQSLGPNLELLESLGRLVDDAGDGITGAITYAGVLQLDDHRVAYQRIHSVDELPSPEDSRANQIIAALASPNRLRILRELLGGCLQSSDLQARFDEPTAGGLYHHLRELLAAGLVTQPRRSQYEIAPTAIVPLLTILACSADLANATADDSDLA
ncbi:MAG: ArsR/SmtB family transcription factor [Gaiellaceae bacterium]